MSIKGIKEEILYKLEDIKHFPYRAKHFILKILKIIKYIPVLWKDEDWDYEYLLALMKEKILRMHKCLKEENMVEDSELSKMLETMEKVVKHISNYQNVDEVYEKTFGKFPIRIGHSSIPSPENDRFYRMITINLDTKKELTEEEEEAYTNFIISKNKFEQQEWENIFDTIKNSGQTWWS